MGNYPYEGIDIKDDSIILTKEFIERTLDICKYGAEKSKELGDNDTFSYLNGRIGFLNFLLENWKYKKEE